MAVKIKMWKIIKNNALKIFMILMGILLITSIVNLFSVSISATALKTKVSEMKEANKPAEIELFTIKTDCINCFDIFSIVESVKKNNVKILKEETISKNSDKAKEFIQKYGIEKLPSIVIFGETNKTNLNGFEEVKDALIFKQVKPPYIDARTSEVKGKVEIITILDSSCKKCISLSPILDNLKRDNVFISSLKNVEYNSANGIELINKFGIKKVPTLLISSGIDYYETIKQGLAQLNSIKKQGFYAVHPVIPPYRDLTSNKITGLVDLIMLKDNTCSNCYDVQNNKQILTRFGIEINDEKTYDISSVKGKELISKYNIKKVPIIILSPEANAYDSFVNVWQEVGTKEGDGWFIMRKPEVLGIYKDLTSNLIISGKQ